MIDNRVLYKSDKGHAAVQAAYDESVKSWGIPVELIIVDTRHGQTHVLAAGPKDAPPLFFFHGWNGSACATGSELDVRALTQKFRLYSPDTVGQSGRSAPNRPSVEGDAYGEWLVDVLDGLKVEKAFVSGISGGGYLTLKLASYAPDRVAKAFAISTAGVMSLARPPLKFLLGALPAFIYPSQATGRLFVRNVSSPEVPFTPAHDEMARMMAMLFRHYRMIGSPGYLSDDELRRITAPTYILMGSHDSTVSADATAERARRLIPNVQAEIIPQGGHVLTMDCPELVMSRFWGFITEN